VLKITQQVVSLSMAMVVLLSTFNVSIYKHYCSNILVETSISHLPEGCGMETVEKDGSDCSTFKKDCCSDEHFFVEGQDELQAFSESFDLIDQVLINDFSQSITYLFQIEEENVPVFRIYKPPSIQKELFKLDESYLI
jgi:hypothetical protein